MDINTKYYRTTAFFLIIVWSLAFAAVFGYSMVQGDTLWHIKTGEWIIKHHCVPKADPFSWTARGLPWHAHEWLWEVLAYGCWRFAGKWGVWGLMTLGSVLFGVGTYAFAYRYSKGWALPTSLITVALSHLYWSARPHTLAYSLFAVWFALFAASESHPKLLCALPLISAFWANIHSSAPIAPLFALLWLGAEAFGKKEWSWKDPRLFGATASLLAVAMNPWGFGIFPYMLRASSQTAIVNYVEEWFSPDFHSLWGKLILIVIAIVLVFWSRVPVKLRFMMGLSLLMGLVSRRHLVFFFYFSGAGVATVLPRIDDIEKLKKAFAIGAALIASISIGAMIMFFPPSWVELPQEKREFPIKAVAWMKENGVTDRVFNLYSWGGYLIWSGIPPFIDGRADLYELSDSGVFEDYKATVGIGDSLYPDKVFAKRGVKTVLFSSGTWLDKYLKENRDWRCVYRDSVAVVYIRKVQKD